MVEGWRQSATTLRVHLPVWLLFFFVSGIEFARTGLLSNAACALAAAVFLFLAALLLLLGKRAAGLSVLLPAFFLLGILLALPYQNRQPHPGHIAAKIGGNSRFLVTGVVSKAPSRAKNGTLFEMYATGIALQAAAPAPGLPRIQPTHGAVQLFLNGDLPADIAPGTFLLVSAFLRPTSPALNPGEFDFGLHLAAKGILVSGKVSSPLLVTKIRSSSPLSWRTKILIAGESIRHKTSKSIDRLLPLASKEARGIYKALLIGEQQEIPAYVFEAFRVTGCMHILSISGLHMGILAVFFYWLFSALLRQSTRLLLNFSLKATAATLSLMPLLVYAFLAGLNPPVIRSLLMAILVVLSLVAARPTFLVNNTAAAAFLMLVANPQHIHTASFQLSFAAVFSLALVAPWLAALFSHPSTGQGRFFFSMYLRGRRFLLASILVSIVASLATAPLLLLHFNNISLIGPIANLVIEPLLCFWSLLLGLIALPLATILPDLASFLLHSGAAGIDTAVSIALLLQKIPWSSFWGASPSPWAIVLAYCLGFGLLLSPAPSTTTTKISVIAFALLLLLPTGRMAKRFLSDRTNVTFLAVGHGNSVLVEMPGNVVILIDGGNKSNSNDVGQRIIAPLLWEKGIIRLDSVVVSHDDSDHYNGLFFVLERFRPKSLVVGPAPAGMTSYGALLLRAEMLGIPVYRPMAGERLHISRLMNATEKNNGELSLDVLRGNEVDIRRHVTSNSQCMVFRLRHGSYSFLLPGDIEENEERELLSAGLVQRSDVLMAAHHGSRSSGSLQFLQTVNPGWLVVSAEGSSPFFPAERLVAYARDNKIPLLVTGKNGAVFFSTNGKEKMEMRTFLRPR